MRQRRLLMTGGILALLLIGPLTVSAAAASSPTPSPTAVDCPDGYLPKMNRPGNDVWGIDWVPAIDGETRTYCFQLEITSSSLIMAVADHGGNQCSWKNTEFIPPPGSRLETRFDDGINATHTFRKSGGLPLPVGTYRIRTTPSASGDCRSWYWVVVYP